MTYPSLKPGGNVKLGLKSDFSLGSRTTLGVIKAIIKVIRDTRDIDKKTVKEKS